ncbi:hypothetical protein FIBSPDRAFT_866806 [Athelia psychrophila]|uniref:Uncharacterized protein n=1 Tax=Athelia psychrophila TaxID=1759441 RepID=A0A166EEP8_9AGAM|nr:hypothetical protein FIBSPDRAFT_866806 [Fibularhizoctonia sp. CBS 109695]
MQAHFILFRMGSWIGGNGARDDDDASPGTEVDAAEGKDEKSMDPRDSFLESAFPSVLSSHTPYSFSIVWDTCSCSLLTIYTSSLPYSRLCYMLCCMIPS